MTSFYVEPTMVKFLDPNYFEDDVNYENSESENEYWLSGIAYKDEIICGCCGGVFNIEELIEDYGEEKLKFEELGWIDIVGTIIGD